MANFTITRQTEPSDDYGCTNFQTNQMGGDTALLSNPLAALDGDIIWYLDADFNYTVSVDNFSIPNTIASNAVQTLTYRTFIDDGSGLGLEPPVLGVVMDQVSQTRIKITVYLHPEPNHFIGGSVFTMPNTNVSTTIQIDGCADLLGNGAAFKVVNTNTSNVNVNLKLADNLSDDLVFDDTDVDNIVVQGVIPSDKSTDVLATYTVTTKDGERFKSEPQLQFSNAQYKVTSTLTKDNEGNTVGKTFNIFKR
tara:strand:- start:7975 stop:8727 length:753 start_codon:yes stop_codon:yes gene_type:complete